MTADSALTREGIEGVIRAFEDRDAAAAASHWAEDGVFVDPHYPEDEYRGPEAVEAALGWALENVVERPGLSIRTVWEGEEAAAVEVDTHHVAHDGSVREFPQVFVVEGEDGRITRWQSYLPFPPPDG
ncbi:nuclear transport factor 2 family protein [Halomicrobium salinisoli]|uniref:nuclear transport factor 2 family protein n=1 Tax=Halomicrobium salinisoli TaxID=2878391 RepID=UPI001CF06287|nr:nuclear transport factor 2 family protein [Halomicrobium salinisoli]